MGLIQAFTGALGGTFADQWIDIITADPFDELTVVSPGVPKQTNAGRGSNYRGSENYLTAGSKIFVPENTAAFVYSQAGIETVVDEPGGYVYTEGGPSVFAGDSVRAAIKDQVGERMRYGGQTAEQKQVAFVNMRELRGIKFGTPGPLPYHDIFYGADLEVRSYGTFSLRVVDPVQFLRSFVPPNVFTYSFADPAARRQILPEFLQSFAVALNSFSSSHRISELPGQARTIAQNVTAGTSEAASWVDRFGLEVVGVGVESIDFTEDSRELVRMYSKNLMNLKAYEGVSEQASNVAAQQKIAAGVEEHGLGTGGGMLFGMGLAQSLDPRTGSQVGGGQWAAGRHAGGGQQAGAGWQSGASQHTGGNQPAASQSGADPSGPGHSGRGHTHTTDDQIETLRKLADLRDADILTEEEFSAKKKQILGL